jgi:hypothetical protein
MTVDSTAALVVVGNFMLTAVELVQLGLEDFSAERVVRWAVASLVAVDCRRGEARSLAAALVVGCSLAQVESALQVLAL